MGANEPLPPFAVKQPDAGHPRSPGSHAAGGTLHRHAAEREHRHGPGCRARFAKCAEARAVLHGLDVQSFAADRRPQHCRRAPIAGGMELAQCVAAYRCQARGA